VALAAAFLLMPRPSPAAARVRALVSRGRLLGLRVVARHRARRWRPSPWWAARVGCAGCVVAVAARLGPVLGLVTAVVAATASALVAAAMRRRAESFRRRQLLVAVRLLVAELDAGARPAAALAAAAAACPAYAHAFGAAAAAARAGGPAGAALLLAAEASAELEPLGQAWRVAESAGTGLRGVLGRVAGDLGARADQERAVAVALAGPRTSALLLAGLPGIGIVLGIAMGAKPLGFLLDTPAGRMVCAAGVLLDALGVLWTQRLLLRAERP
jgi:tight adherence protein B